MKPIWHNPVDLEEINERAKRGLSSHLGIVFTAIGDDSLTASMPVDETTIQPMGILHGGATCALAETVGSAAANYCVDQQTHICVGLEINVNHIKSVRSGQLFATAKPLHLGKSTQVWDIKVLNDTGQLIAISRLTMAVIVKR